MPSGVYAHHLQQGFQKGNSFGKRFEKGIVIPTEWRLKISRANKGKHYSVATEFKGNRVKVEVKCYFCNKEFIRDESLLKKRKKHFCSHSCYAKSMQGENSSFWKGGISFKPYPLGWTQTFKEQIRYRDGYKCQICGCPEVECKRKLDIHHIDYIKENLAFKNLISLCRYCHTKTNNNRNHWKVYFQNKRRVVK